MPNKSAEKVAEEQLRQEEESRRARRVEELAAAEERRRAEQKRLTDLEKVSARLADEADSYNERRRELAEGLQEKLEGIKSGISELAELDREQAFVRSKASLAEKELERAGQGKGGDITAETVEASPRRSWINSGLMGRNGVVSRWLTASLPDVLGDHHSPQTATSSSLTDMDNVLSPKPATGKPIRSKAAGGTDEEQQIIDASAAEDRERRRANDAAKKLQDLQRRRDKMRSDYGRMPSFTELVPSEERGRIAELFTASDMESARALVEEVSDAAGKPAVSSDMVSGGSPGGAA